MNKDKNVKIAFSIIFAIALIFNFQTVYATNTADDLDSEIVYPQDVTAEMSDADYWKDKIDNEDEILLTTEEIEDLNQSIIDGSGTKVFDIETIGDNVKRTQTEYTEMLSNNAIPERNLYIDGELIDNEEYYTEINNAIKETGYKSDEKKVYYAVATERADMKDLPTDDVIGYNEADPDDEILSSVLNVNDPFVIYAKCDRSYDRFYWGYSNNCSGWVNGQKLAIVDDKKEWIDAWKVDIDGNDFVVVTNDKVILEKSLTETQTSEVKLTIGTVLKLVSEEEIPVLVGERGTYNNYVVYLPTRNEEGKYEKQVALISEHEGVNVGFLPFTQGNILDVAFNCLGDRYGWGGMLDAMDCSLYTRLVYKCFGIELPRNTTWQQKTPNLVHNLSKMTAEEKQKFIEEAPVGSLLYFSGHTMIYIGTENDKSYVISALGYFYEDNIECDAYSIAINPLTVKRKNGRTWLDNLTSILIPISSEKHGTANNETNSGNIKYVTNVTQEMANADFWKNLIDNSDKILLNELEIDKLNQAIIDGSGTMVFDLTSIEDNLTKTQTDITNNLASSEIPTRALYINGIKINNEDYFTKIKNAIKNTGYKSDEKKAYYAIAVKRTDLKSWPTIDVIGYNEADPDDEMESAILNVNEPFVILGKCDIDGETYYWGYSNNCTGWVYGKHLAIVDKKEDWIDAWKVDIDGKDFIVVTNDKVVTEKSLTEPQTSEIKLTIGTTLKLVPNSELPKQVGERGIYNNYVVYLPTRNEEGKFEKKIALISEHEGVNVGFLPLTQGNILDVAFNCLGDRYGWGGMLDAMDCSLYTRLVYKCFGIELPRNTTWQQKTPDKVTNVSNMTIVEKEEYLEGIHVGSLLYFPGHTMIYIGNKEGVSYVISALGSFVESTGKISVIKAYSIVENPLTVRRASGYTWLSQIASVLSLKDITPKVYEYIKGENQTFNISQDGNLSFEVNIDFSDFVASGKVYMDGVLVDISNYTVRKGSTIITFNEDYTKTLSIGNHVLKIAVDDGEATTKFSIANNEDKNDENDIKETMNNDESDNYNLAVQNKITNNPKTGDMGITPWLVLIIISIIGIHVTKERALL